MTTTMRLMTADELLALPKLDVLYELIDGEVFTMAPAGERHGEIGIALAGLLAPHVREHRLGRMYISDTGCRLAWVIDPAKDTLTVYTPPGTPGRTLGLDDVLDGGDVIPSFSCSVRDALYWPE